MTETRPFDLLRRHARDPRTGWSLGIFGAIAEFMRDADEPARTVDAEDRFQIGTDRGALRIVPHPEAQIIDFTTPSRHPERRMRAAVACLPASSAARAGRRAIAEIGPDRDAVREEDREARLFDLGIGLDCVEACVRTTDPALIDALRAAEGRGMFEVEGLGPVLLAAAPHRVFISALGRIEVYQPIPAPGGVSPEGPHTHVLPQLIAHGRTHAATVPIPEGLVPCLSVHPPQMEG